MGNPKQKWTAEEEEALRAGVAKHGTGKWKDIQRDPEFNKFLFSRSNIDLKDKWRNMIGGGSGQAARDKSRVLKAKAARDVPSPAAAQSLHAPVQDDGSADPVVDVPSKALDDVKSAPRYNEMILEALAALKELNGSDIGAIFNYIERRHEVPQNFRKLLSSRLRRLVAQDKLEKHKDWCNEKSISTLIQVQNGYKLKEETSSGVKALPLLEKDVQHRQFQPFATTTPNIKFGETVEEAAIAAAYKIAEAENKAFVAAEAVKDAERVSKMAEDADSMLLLAREILDRCMRDEHVLVA
ncbi:hypothetical protein SAY87_007047 [Trapa incisa]|uniref:MYB transcription factor n=1 Tax=Trapa incisa TaxID=236973 RepID=A0AAN7Q4Z4_9MYRT|nr:hypothetical protein SAY87_007047 [Trapa incisa]